jgi:hypothetical protein
MRPGNQGGFAFALIVFFISLILIMAAGFLALMPQQSRLTHLGIWHHKARNLAMMGMEKTMATLLDDADWNNNGGIIFDKDAFNGHYETVVSVNNYAEVDITSTGTFREAKHEFKRKIKRNVQRDMASDMVIDWQNARISRDKTKFKGLRLSNASLTRDIVIERFAVIWHPNNGEVLNKIDFGNFFEDDPIGVPAGAIVSVSEGHQLIEASTGAGGAINCNPNKEELKMEWRYHELAIPTKFTIYAMFSDGSVAPLELVLDMDGYKIDLKTAESFALLAATMTNENPTDINGNVGSGAGGQTAPPSTISGTNHFNNTIYNQANTGLLSALADTRTRDCDYTTVAAVAMGGSTMTPGVYCFGGAFNMAAGTILTLDGAGLYIFKITGALNTGAGASVVLTGGATSDRIFWVMTGATTLAADSNFVGTILSSAAITIGTGTTVDGRVFTTEALTIATSTVTDPNFSAPPEVVLDMAEYTTDLKTAGSFALLAATLTNANPINITGDVGSGVGGPISEPSTISGTHYLNDAVYNQANTDLLSALADERTRDCDDTTAAAVAMGGSTITPGVYCFDGAFSMAAGTILTLDGAGFYMFKITGALDTGAGASVVLTGGATSDKIFWVMTGATTLAADSNFVGTILSDAAITIGTGTTVDGRVFTSGALTIAASTVVTAPN